MQSLFWGKPEGDTNKDRKLQSRRGRLDIRKVRAGMCGYAIRESVFTAACVAVHIWLAAEVRGPASFRNIPQKSGLSRYTVALEPGVSVLRDTWLRAL